MTENEEKINMNIEFLNENDSEDMDIVTNNNDFNNVKTRELKEMSPMPDFDEKIEDEEEPKSKKLDWEALIAAAEEDFDLLESPVDAAAKTLKSGKEIQKLSVIRKMPETIIACKDEAIRRLFPLIQNMVFVSQNLDVHCDTSDLYKLLIKDEKYEEHFPGLKDKMISYIIENVETVTDNVAAAAWLEALLDITDNLPVQIVTNSIVPLAISQASPNKRQQRRIIASKLIEKLCSIIPVEFIRKDLAPCAKMLCQDPNATVRTAIAQRLSIIAESLNNSADCVSLLLPCLIELCKDDDPNVREAILNTIAVCLPYFTKESRKTVVIPLLRKCTEQALILRDNSLTVVAKQLGTWLYSLKDILSQQELKWFLDTFCRIVNLSIPNTDKNLQNLSIICKRMSAYNFPCFSMIYNNDTFYDKLLPILEKFVNDTDDEIKSTIAAGFHEIVILKSNEYSLLLLFINMIKSGSINIVQNLVKNFDKMIPIFYDLINNDKDKKTTKIQLKRIIVGCNKLIRNTGNWRSHESYLYNLIILKKYLTPNELLLTFVPMLKQEVLTARALPCRIAAATTLLSFMREFPLQKNRQNIIEFFTKTIGKHESYHRRRILLDIVPYILNNFSRNFFKQNFMDEILKMNNDSVSNIRLKLCRLMPSIKEFLLIPEDDKELLLLEKSVKSLLTSDTITTNDRQLLQLYACELSRAETISNLKTDSYKLSEEKKLWTEIDDSIIDDLTTKNNNDTDDTIITNKKPPHKKGVVHKKKQNNLVIADGKTVINEPLDNKTNSLLKPPTSNGYYSSVKDDNKTSTPWKTSRIDTKSKIAIVKPQPQVVITQRSPSPMPPRQDDIKSSKLPLSTRYRYMGTSSSPTTSSPPTTSRYRSFKMDTSSPLSRSSSTTRSNLSYSPSSSSLMSRSMTSSYTEPSNNYSSSGLMTSRSMSSIRRPYGLMKVQSSSSIERKPANLSIKVTGMS